MYDLLIARATHSSRNWALKSCAFAARAFAVASQTARPAGGKQSLTLVVVVQRQADLLQVVDALGPPGRLARRLHGGQEQGDQHGDDGDDDQQLDQRESAARDDEVQRAESNDPSDDLLAGFGSRTRSGEKVLRA